MFTTRFTRGCVSVRGINCSRGGGTLQALAAAGVSCKGAIVIMRYGVCFRGLKVKNAEDAGAVGSIIYSDPQQDGSVAPIILFRSPPQVFIGPLNVRFSLSFVSFNSLHLFQPPFWRVLSWLPFLLCPATH